MNKKLKKLISCLLAFVMCVTIVLTSSRDSYAAKDQFSIELNASISQDQNYFEVEIEITNSGKDFSGVAELQVQSNYYYSYSGYDVAISIPSGSTKTYTVKVPAKGVSTGQTEMVVIYDSNARKQYSEKFKNTFTKTSGTLKLGILSDSADELSFLDLGGGSIDLQGSKYKITTQELTAGDLEEELDGLDYLVVNDYDTSVLSEEQISSIEQFVNSGGYLIIGTGENGEEVLSGFDGSFVDAPYNYSYSTSLYIDGDYEDHEITVASIGYDYSYSGLVESYSKYYGLGSVSIVGFDMRLLEKMNEVSEPTELILQNAFSFSNNGLSSYDQLDMYMVEDIQGYMEKPANMGSVALILLIIVYVVLVGPIIYLILKRFNMREKMWLVIPAISLIFVFFVFLISFGVKVRGLTLKSVTIEQLGKPVADTVIFGYIPNPEPWTVETKDEMEYGYVISEYDYGAPEGSVKGQLLETSDSYRLTFNASSSFETGAFSMTSKTEPKKGFQIQMDGATLTQGTVTNDSDLSFDYVMIYNNNGYQIEKNVSPGETIKVSFVGNGYYSGSSTLLYGEARDAYRDGEYSNAAELAAIAMACDYVGTGKTIVVGVKKGDSVTTENEPSWHCYYSVD